MATLREISYDILEILNAYSDDHNIPEEQIVYTVNNKRNMLLKQYMSNLKKEIPTEAKQVICLSLEVEEDCFEGIDVLKSTIKVPATLHNTGRSNIVKAYSSGFRLSKHMNVIDYSRIPFVGKDKYMQDQLFLAVDPKSYLVAYNTDNKHLLLETIEVEGVFEDPEEAFLLSCETIEDVDYYDMEYPVESSMIDPIKNQVVQELLLKFQVPVDNINDGEYDARFENIRINKR